MSWVPPSIPYTSSAINPLVLLPKPLSCLPTSLHSSVLLNLDMSLCPLALLVPSLLTVPSSPFVLLGECNLCENTNPAMSLSRGFPVPLRLSEDWFSCLTKSSLYLLFPILSSLSQLPAPDILRQTHILCDPLLLSHFPFLRYIRHCLLQTFTHAIGSAETLSPGITWLTSTHPLGPDLPITVSQSLPWSSQMD